MNGPGWVLVDGPGCADCGVPLYRRAGVQGRNPARCPGCDPRRVVGDVDRPAQVAAVDAGDLDGAHARSVAEAWRDAYVALVADTWQVPMPWSNRRLPWEPHTPPTSPTTPRTHPDPLPTQLEPDCGAYTATQTERR